MEIENSISELEDMLENSWGLPMSGGRIVLNSKEVRRIVEDIRLNLPSEIVQAQKIVSERNKVIESAKTEAETMIKVSEEKIRTMVSESEIVKSAQNTAANIITEATTKAKEIRASANEYINEMMKKLDQAVTQSLVEIRKARQALDKKPTSNENLSE